MRGLRKAIITSAVVAVIGLSGGAYAANSLKSGAKPAKVKPISKEEFADLRGKLGACIVSRNQSAVKKYLENSDSMTVDYRGMGVDPRMAMFMFRMDACTKFNVPQMAQPIFATPGALRNLLLEADYLEKQKAKPAPLLDSNGQPAPARVRAFVTKDDKLQAATAYAALADCTAALGTDLADTVLRTGAGLADERAAAVALAPVIGGCVAEGQDVQLTPATIRALAAEGLWQRYATPNTARASAQ
jgi:hypothetical protein